MKAKLTKTLLSLGFLALLFPAVGCDLRRGPGGGSYSDFAFALDFLPGFGGYDFVDVYDEGYAEDEFFFDDYGDDSYYEEEDFFFFDDGWKSKKPG
ncbi:MAG: hypothetical protein ACE5E1_07675 [Phycisphaerae bacterium]